MIGRRDILQQCYSAILVARHQIPISVKVPVKSDGNNHLQIHCERSTVGSLDTPTSSIFRADASADVLEIRHSIKKLATDQVEVSVSVEVGEVRRWTAKNLQHLIGGLQLLWRSILGATQCRGSETRTPSHAVAR